MTAPSWDSWVQVLPDGRILISRARMIALGVKNPDRVVEMLLRGRPAKAILLDRPFLVEGEVHDFIGSAYFLAPIRMRDLPGWPPRLVSRTGHVPPSILECCLRSATLKRHDLELEVERSGTTYAGAWSELPVALKTYVGATLRADAAAGQKLGLLQDWTLAPFGR